jgi:hypothetical protein
MLSWLVLLFLSAASATSADSLRTVLQHGSRIRMVETAEPSPRQVFLAAISGDSVWYHDDARGPLLAKHCAALKRIDMSGRQRGKALVGALVGGGAGAGIGAFAASRNKDSGVPFDLETNLVNGAAPFIGLVGGVLLGALAGSQIRTHDWHPITQPCAIAPIPPIEPGDALRVYFRGNGPPLIGSLEANSTGTLRLKDPDSAGERTISWDSIERIDLRERVGNRAGQRALIGGFIGGAVGIELAALLNLRTSVVSAGGVALGTGVGALTGLGVTRDIWRPIPIDQLKRMGFTVSL